MIGALIGDIVGSVYEFDNIKTKNFLLLSPNSHFTDDSVMTLAVAEIMQKGYVSNGKKIVNTFRKWGRNFINAGYGELFIHWLLSDNPQPYGSYGNGAAMRVSPVAWYADSVGEVKEYARAVTQVTHNHPEGLKGAEVTAMCVYYARIGRSKEFIRKYAEQYYDLNFDYEQLRKNYFHVEESCQNTVPVAIYCFLISDSFEDCLRSAVSIGGDCDTTSAIAGAISEAYYKKINRELIVNALSRLPAAKNGCDAQEVIYNYASRKKFLCKPAIKLNYDTLSGIDISKINAIKLAQPGAMGEPGEIYIISGKGENVCKYHGNICNFIKKGESVDQKLYNKIKERLGLMSLSFVEVYMGYGNFLYIRKNLSYEFNEATKDMDLSQIYTHYRGIIWRLLQ